MNPDTVTHPSTNRARCKSTSLIEANALSLRHTVPQRRLPPLVGGSIANPLYFPFPSPLFILSVFLPFYFSSLSLPPSRPAVPSPFAAHRCLGSNKLTEPGRQFCAISWNTATKWPQNAKNVLLSNLCAVCHLEFHLRWIETIAQPIRPTVHSHTKFQ